jgi:hypothetical protein
MHRYWQMHIYEAEAKTNWTIQTFYVSTLTPIQARYKIGFLKATRELLISPSTQPVLLPQHINETMGLSAKAPSSRTGLPTTGPARFNRLCLRTSCYGGWRRSQFTSPWMRTATRRPGKGSSTPSLISCQIVGGYVEKKLKYKKGLQF